MKVCFVAPNAYPLLSGRHTEAHIGGAELQQVQIARGLQGRGWEVSFVCRDFGQGTFKNVDGIPVYGTFVESDGLPVLRFFYPRVVKLWSALCRAAADVYYTRTASFLPGVLRHFCTRHGGKYCFAGALDSDFEPDRLPINNFRDRWLYEYGLRGAHAVSVQSRHQQTLVRNNFGLEGRLLPNFLPSVETLSTNQIVLWVATIRKRKRPMLFVELARKFPRQKFVMIGGPLAEQPELYEHVKKESDKVPNLDFLGFQPLDTVESFFSCARVFVNTSSNEGFPNTFLQAWRRGLAVVSLLDPDHSIANNRLGAVAGSEFDLEPCLAKVLSDGYDPQHIRGYFEAHHGAGLLDEYQAFFESMA